MKRKPPQLLCFLILFTFVLASCSLSGSSQGEYLVSSNAAPETPLLAEVLMHLQLDYVHPEKLDPEKLLQGALTELERMVPEVWVVAKLRNKSKEPRLEIRVEKETSVLPVSELHGLYDLHIALQKLTKHLLQTKIQLTQLKIEQLFARGILNRLDSYSVLLPIDIYQEFNINIGGQFAGVGLVVGTREGQLTVIAPMDGSPAALAGMKPLDRIVAVDDEKTEHLTLDEILHRLRGEIGTPVTLSVLRKGHTKTLTFELLREEIQLESVETFDLESDIQTVRYVRIKNFQKDTSHELKNKLGDLNKIDGLILDLRNNPGGLLEEAIRVSDLFLQGKQRIVSTKGPSVSTIHDAKQLFAGGHLQSIPLVVLINRGSASASEIVAAALKQNERAIVIGEQSFGKGTVQTLWDLKDGSGLKLTIGEYLTPSGHSIHNIGVMPSLRLIPVSVPESKGNQSGDADQQQTIAQERFRLLPEVEVDSTVNYSDILQLRYLSSHTSLLDDAEIIEKDVIIEKLNADIFVKIAKHVLQKWNPQNINSTLQKIALEFEQQEAEKIAKALTLHGIDWSLIPDQKTPIPETLKLTWLAEEVSEDLVRLKVQLRNLGDISGQRLIVVTKAGNVLLDGLEFPIGKLPTDEVKSRTLNVKFSAGMMEETEPLELELFDHNLKKLKSVRLQLNFSPKRISSFKLKMRIFDNGKFGSRGNADGKVQSGETIALAFELENKGQKTVPELLLKIRGTDGVFRINRGKIMLKNLDPLKKQKDYFLFKTLTNSKTLGKISMEMVDTKSGSPKIVHLWNLENALPQQTVVTPEFNGLKWQDLDGNLVKGETELQSLILSGNLSNATDVRDVFVYLNDEKVFYSANFDKLEESTVQHDITKEFQFTTVLELVPGKNLISVFSRNRSGFTSERRLRILRRE
ncbi:MAG: PDZ domain-containing protein [SAR324 cluster bacterium]|jgi:carboxyl-terminal processing protease|nr:PDZ domain-containing protein [SAR324 cluster bacterium]